MKMTFRMWLNLGVIGAAFLVGAGGLYAEEQKVLPKGMTPEKLERSVNKTLSYVDERLLSGKSAQKIEESGNQEAIDLLAQSRKKRDKIAEQINQGQHEEAYWALKELNKSLKEAMSLSRAKERAVKEAKDRLDSARTISDAYQQRAHQRGLSEGEGGSEALNLYDQAQAKREQAQAAEAAEDHKTATEAYQSSTKLLKGAIALVRRQDEDEPAAEPESEVVATEQPVEEVAEGKALPKGMTPEKLERSVNKTLSYVDKRLLSGKSAQKIEESSNKEAIALLEQGRKERDKIAEQINKGQHEEAYWALKELNKSLKEAMSLSRAKERAAKELKDNLESARTISDAYHERAHQRGLHEGEGSAEALALYKQAKQQRERAHDAEAADDFKTATEAYQSSSKFLKGAIALVRRQGEGEPSAEPQPEVAAKEQPAEEGAERKALPKGMTPEKLERSVNKTLSYIDKRLLRGKSAKKIEESGNEEAIALLAQSRKERDKIAELIDQGQNEEAYWALKELNKSLKEAMRLSRAKDRAAKVAEDNLESARTISDAYQERANQRRIGEGEGGHEARMLYKQAQEKREQAQSAEAAEDHQSATAAYQSSTKLLKSAIALARRQNGEQGGE